MSLETFNPLNVVGNIPEELLAFDRDPIGLVERTDDFFIALQTERSQEDRGQELPLSVDADVEDVLRGFVFELHPRSAVRNDLSEEVALARRRFKEHARTAMQLADDDALGSVDDERAVLGHQRNFAEVDFLLLDVANRLGAGVRILVENREADDDLQRRGIGHAAFLAFRHVVLQVELNRIAALVAEGDLVLVLRAALRAHHGGLRRERIRGDRGAAALAGGAQLMRVPSGFRICIPSCRWSS